MKGAAGVVCVVQREGGGGGIHKFLCTCLFVCSLTHSLTHCPFCSLIGDVTPNRQITSTHIQARQHRHTSIQAGRQATLPSPVLSAVW